MTKGSGHNVEAQITSKMRELIACMCVVEFKQEGDRRGMIEGIESLILGNDFAESFERSQFKVHLTSGDVVIVLGSAISTIESGTAGSDSKHARKEPGGKARKARTKKMLAEKRKSISTKPSKKAAEARVRRAPKKANPRSSR